MRGELEGADWEALLAWRERGGPSPCEGSPLAELYGPLCAVPRGRPFAVAHLAQSLDGRIATVNGASQWLSGEADLLHAHRMRALADAILVGVGTVLSDDPQLTVRRCPGSNPVRVVIDPERRLDGTQGIFRDGAARTLIVTGEGRAQDGETLGLAEYVPVPRGPEGLDPRTIRDVLARRGLHWLFIEGGGVTISRFLKVGALDRLQITIAPVILGSGRPSIDLPEITDIREGLRPRVRHFPLGDDILVECIFHD